MESSEEKHINFFPNRIFVVKKTRNQRFREALERNHSKTKKGGKASTDKKLHELRNRSIEIQSDPDRLELLNWIVEIQEKLGYTNLRFAQAVGVSKSTIENWRKKRGYMPSMKNFKRLLELEKLTRISVQITKNKNYFIKEKATIRVVIR